MPKTAPDPGAAPEDAPDAQPTADAPLPVDNSKRVKIDLLIAQWVSANLYNSPLSRSTEAWNHLSAQLPQLAGLLEKEL